jgi:hypothetical protein
VWPGLRESPPAVVAVFQPEQVRPEKVALAPVCSSMGSWLAG